MTTSGGRENHRSRWFTSLTVLLGVTLLAGLTSAGQAGAVVAPLAGKAEIVYSNGGRLVKIDSDGGNREVLTRSGRTRTPGTSGHLGDRFPSVSPDGNRVLFLRNSSKFAPDNEFLFSGRNMLLNLSTGKVREVLPARAHVTYRNLAWLPGTGRVLASKIVHGRTVIKTSVVSVKLDGTGERTILRFRDYKGGLRPDDLNFEAARLEASPDGSRFLMTRMDYWSEAGYTLELVDVDSGRRKLVAKHAHSGSWSPDGERFAFVEDRGDEEVCDWDFDCTPSGDLYLANGDGTHPRRLTSSPRDESHPSWSPDGNRIVFSGTVGRPRDRSTGELFSIGTDGRCLTGLTNGSPASVDPAFIPGSAAESTSCGLSDRPVLAEGHLNRRTARGFGRRLWFGPRSSQGLLSLDTDLTLSNFSYSLYGDCGTFRARDCPDGASLITFPVCSSMGSWAHLISQVLRVGHKRRGVWVEYSRRGKRGQTIAFSGPQATIIGDLTVVDGGKGPILSRSEQLKLFDELRPVGRKLAPKLPRLLLPDSEYRIARQVRRYVKRHSLAAAVEWFNGERSDVVDYLRFRQNARRIGAGRINCPDSWEA